MAKFPRLWLLPVSEFYLFVHGWFTEVNICFTLPVLLRDFQIWISTEFKLDGVRSGVRYQPFPPVWNDMKQYSLPHALIDNIFFAVNGLRINILNFNEYERPVYNRIVLNNATLLKGRAMIVNRIKVVFGKSERSFCVSVTWECQLSPVCFQNWIVVQSDHCHIFQNDWKTASLPLFTANSIVDGSYGLCCCKYFSFGYVCRARN